MAQDEAAAKERFRRFVGHALDEARAHSLTDKQIHQQTGVTPSTFHRWRREGWRRQRPQIDVVVGFCNGLGIPLDVAYSALGRDARGQTEPEPTIPPSVRKILRKLADPSVPEAEKWYIRETLDALANRPTRRADQTG